MGNNLPNNVSLIYLLFLVSRLPEDKGIFNYHLNANLSRNQDRNAPPAARPNEVLTHSLLTLN